MPGKTEYYFQCRLKKQNIDKGGWYFLTTWVKEKFAKPGNKVKVEMDDGTWSHGWTVVDCWERATKEEVRERQNYYKTQREASDI